MDELFKQYSKKTVRGTDELKMFSTFYDKYRKNIEEWVNKHLAKLQTKNDDKAMEFKLQGNKFYIQKEFKKGLEFYTRALCHAVPESESYGLILANRSAVLYMMGDYKTCLKDIELCLKAKCPESTRLKVLIRKIKCCAKMGSQNQLNAAITEATGFIEKCLWIADKGKLQEEIDDAAAIQASVAKDLKCEAEKEIPDLKDGANEHFLFASSAIRLCYDKTIGRHVKANKELKKGDVIFVEKPFIFAPVFINESMDLPLNKCYNCLKTIRSCIPCNTCIRCIYCDEKCREHCWNEFHKWECVGMQTNLWYHIGIAFPALRSLIRGISLGMCTLNSDYEADTINYGDKQNNYGYFNKLVSNISKMPNVLPLILSATVVVVYLQQKTDFFEWLKDQQAFPDTPNEELVTVVGGRITKHIAQLQCNSSAINHDDEHSNKCSVACGIYPSISMMNHSCKSNINMYYREDTVIAQAAETISANDEVVNCYGIDCDFTDWKTRQEHCKDLYFFKCECRPCKLEYYLSQ